jgi:hypothetical protein
MPNRFANLVGGGAAFVALALFVISPLLGQPRGEYAKAGAVFILLAAFGLVLLYNKWRFGRVFPVQLNEAQRAAIRQRAQAGNKQTLVLLLGAQAVVLPLLFVLARFDWSKQTKMLVAMVVGLLVIVLLSFLYRRVARPAE